jgi:holo-[acyl-carrier protein] synthase
MVLIGIGLDLIDLPSFRKLYGEPDTDLTRVFSSQELLDAGDDSDRLARLAARLAAKEATLKALGCGLQDGMSLTEIVVVRQATGAPSLELSGEVLDEAHRRGIDSWLVSLTHEEAVAGAVAIAFSAGPRKQTRRASRSASIRPPR